MPKQNGKSQKTGKTTHKAKSYFEPAKVKAKRYEDIIEEQITGHRFQTAIGGKKSKKP